MTTLASPSLGGASQSLWQVRMEPGQAGPWHRMDREQLWTVVDGGVTVEFGGASSGSGRGTPWFSRPVSCAGSSRMRGRRCW
jgi:hypothetical protein